MPRFPWRPRAQPNRRRAGRDRALFHTAVVGLGIGVGVEHLVFLAGPSSRPCDLALHLGGVPGQKCEGIQIVPNEQTIKVVLLCFLECQPRILDAIDRDVVAGAGWHNR